MARHYLLQNIQRSSGAHAASDAMVTGVLYRGGGEA